LQGVKAYYAFYFHFQTFEIVELNLYDVFECWNITTGGALFQILNNTILFSFSNSSNIVQFFFSTKLKYDSSVFQNMATLIVGKKLQHLKYFASQLNFKAKLYFWSLKLYKLTIFGL
jgi:hypothetical protein